MLNVGAPSLTAGRIGQSPVREHAMSDDTVGRYSDEQARTILARAIERTRSVD